jgi:hypothetical protein
MAHPENESEQREAKRCGMDGYHRDASVDESCALVHRRTGDSRTASR